MELLKEKELWRNLNIIEYRKGDLSQIKNNLFNLETKVLEYKPGNKELREKFPFGLGIKVLEYRKGNLNYNLLKEYKVLEYRKGNPNYDIWREYKVLEYKKGDGKAIIKDGKAIKENTQITYFITLHKRISEFIKKIKDLENKSFSEILNYFLALGLEKCGGILDLKFLNVSFSFDKSNYSYNTLELALMIRKEKEVSKYLFEFDKNDYENSKKNKHHIAMYQDIAKNVLLLQEAIIRISGKNKTFSEVIENLVEFGIVRFKELFGNKEISQTNFFGVSFEKLKEYIENQATLNLSF